MEIYGGKGDVSLRIWLPMIKDLRQQGLSNVTVTNNGAIFNSAGKLGGTYSATASGRTITIDFANLSTMLANGKTYTLTCWVKPTGTPSNGWVIKLGNNNCGLWWAKSEARWVWNENDDGKRCANPTISADYTNWHHLAIVVDKTSSGKITTRQYVDGTLANGYPGSTWDNSSHSQPAGTIITISPYVSQLNDIRLYDHCLSPMEVKELAKGLVLHYPLNRGGWGQENLYGHGSDLQTTLKGLNNYNNSFNIIEEDGKKCAHVSGALSTTKYLQSKLTFTPTVMEQFTFSAEVKIKNIIRGTTNPMCEFYFSGVTLDGAWRGFTVEYIKVDGQKVGATAIGFDRYLTDTAWHKVAVTAHFNYNGTSTIPALYPDIYLRDCTGDLYIRNVKLEKGPVATPWCPNSSDTLATTMGLNSTTEYDCSGFCNNGTRVGTFEWTSDTPKYQVSTKFNGSECILRDSPNADIYTLTCWAKTSKSKKTAQFMVADSNSKLSISFYGGNIISYFYGNSAGTGSKCILGTEYKENEWNFFVVVKTGENTRDCYCNGVKLTPTSNDWWSTATGFFIGNRSSGGNGPFYGEICDVRAYATALSADDVKSLYQNSAYIDSSGNVYGAVHEED